MTHFVRLLTLAVISTLFVAFAPGTASACSCMPVTTREMVAEAEMAFEGQEIGRAEVRTEAGGEFWGNVAVTFQVLEAYKGSVPEQITVMTGENSAGCGVGPTAGVVGITIWDAEQPSISICGSVHPAGAIGAILDPIDIVGAAPAPPPPNETGTAFGGIVLAAGVAVIVAGIGIAVVRRRRDWQDGWSSAG